MLLEKRYVSYVHFASGLNKENQIGPHWLQVDFGSPREIAGVITQGQPNLGRWVTSYKMLYGNTTENLVSIQNQEFNADMVRYKK